MIGLFNVACIKMGVKSNCLQGGVDGFELQSSLSTVSATCLEMKTSVLKPKTRGLVDTVVHKNIQTTWPRLNRCIQAAFSLYLLYSGLSSANKPTWGFDRLTLCVTNTPSPYCFHPEVAIHFAEGEMVCVLLTGLQSQVPFYRRCRVHDVL